MRAGIGSNLQIWRRSKWQEGFRLIRWNRSDNFLRARWALWQVWVSIRLQHECLRHTLRCWDSWLGWTWVKILWWWQRWLLLWRRAWDWLRGRLYLSFSLQLWLSFLPRYQKFLLVLIYRRRVVLLRNVPPVFERNSDDYCIWFW